MAWKNLSLRLTLMHPFMKLFGTLFYQPRMKRRIADYCGVAYKEAYEEWLAGIEADIEMEAADIEAEATKAGMSEEHIRERRRKERKRGESVKMLLEKEGDESVPTASRWSFRQARERLQRATARERAAAGGDSP